MPEQNAQKQQPERRQYEVPVLVSYGSLQELTQTGGNTTSDDSSNHLKVGA